MPAINQALEFNTFVGGLVTEASPLTFPDNSSLDEDNFVLDKDGSRSRRLGMDFESGGIIQDSGQLPPLEGDLAFNYFEWENAGGDPEKSIGVVQAGSRLTFFDLDNGAITSSKILDYNIPLTDRTQKAGFSSVDGLLVIATGRRELILATYDGSSISFSEYTLNIRDQFGVDAPVDGVELTEGNNISTRPSNITEAHRYNLMNQTWGTPRMTDENNTSLIDPIQRTKSQTGVYPSNADNLTLHMFAVNDNDSDRITPRYWWKSFSGTPPGVDSAPKGFFIIDALERGASRVQAQNDQVDKQSALGSYVNSLPEDRTPGGARVVSQFGGRVWYSGFSGEVVGGDSKSPRMSSYVLFSRLVKDPSDLNVCYQVGDPTSDVAPDIVDTDGGFIKLDGAYNIQAMYDTGNSLTVLAENGVWTISGGTDSGFSATAYIVRKVSDHGTISPGSVVVVDNGLMYWSDDGIYHLAPDNFGDIIASNISFGKIQTLYDSIDQIDKSNAHGMYDSFERRVRWVYQNRLGSTSESRELVLDTSLGAYYKYSINGVSGGYPKVLLPLRVPPYTVGTDVNNVVSDGVQVVVGTDDVQVTASNRLGATREVAYLSASVDDPTVSYGVSVVSDTSFKDWKSVNGEGVNYLSFLLTGYISGNEHQRDKQVGYITTHFNRTEDGFELVGDDIQPTNQSSCLVQSQWSWTNSPSYGKWSSKFQAYRPKRHYIPENVSEPFDHGQEVLTTKSKLRGRGKVVSLLFESEEGKDLQLLGWGMTIGVNQNV